MQGALVRTNLLVLCCALAVTGNSAVVCAGDVERELRRMVGYTIVSSEHIQSSGTSRSGEDLVALTDGHVFSVHFLGLVGEGDRVVVFVKAPSKEMLAALRGQVLEKDLFSYKLLIENEMYDADLVR